MRTGGLVVDVVVPRLLSSLSFIPVGLGPDAAKATADLMYDEFTEAGFAPPALLLRRVKARRLSRKTGNGLFEYAA